MNTRNIMHPGWIGISLCLATILPAASAQADEPSNPTKAQSMPSSAPSTGTAEAATFDAHAIIASTGLPAHSMAENFQSGYIDWTNGKAIAVGEGKATGTSGQQIDMAQRAARLAAARNAVLLMGNIRVGPGGRFVDIANSNIQVDAVLKNFEEVSSTFDPKTHTATVSMAVPLYGANGVIHILGANPSGPTTTTAQKSGQDVAGEMASVIMIDARGVEIKPCLLPRIVCDKPSEVIFAASEPDLNNHPAAIYVILPAAVADDLSQACPSSVLVLKARKTGEKTSGTIVLDAQETAKLQLHPQWRQLVTSGRLVIVTGTAR